MFRHSEHFGTLRNHPECLRMESRRLRNVTEPGGMIKNVPEHYRTEHDGTIQNFAECNGSARTFTEGYGSFHLFLYLVYPFSDLLSRLLLKEYKSRSFFELSKKRITKKFPILHWDSSTSLKDSVVDTTESSDTLPLTSHLWSLVAYYRLNILYFQDLPSGIR